MTEPDHEFQPKPAPGVSNLCQQCNLPEGNRKHQAADIIVGGTTYGGATPAPVIELLQRYLGSRTTRLRLHYGDQATGQAWGDAEVGYIGRSMGPVKVPLCIANSRSGGGGALLDHCIVKIELARGKSVLWQHPQYHLKEGAVEPS